MVHSFSPSQQEVRSRAEQIIEVSVKEIAHITGDQKECNRSQRLAITFNGPCTVIHIGHGGPTFSRFHNFPT